MEDRLLRDGGTKRGETSHGKRRNRFTMEGDGERRGRDNRV
jgi:hypothetical protein